MPSDVIIAGAGPAGTLAAYTLARAGLSVLILEKQSFPRYKVCGGGITHKALSGIPFSLAPVIEREIRQIRFSCRFTDAFTHRSTQPLLYCTMRDNLDHYLLAQALKAGAQIVFDQHIRSFSQSPDAIVVNTSVNQYSSRFLIGADGASSVVARQGGFKKGIRQGVAWEAEMDAPPEELERYAETVFLDWGTIPGGYGWIFPKSDHFSVGVGGPAKYASRLPGYFDHFVAASGISFTHTRSKKAWPIPVSSGRFPWHHQRVLVVGDAGGLTDPLTGEGIQDAIRSGILAAETIINQYDQTTPDLSRYSLQIRDTLMKEIREADHINIIFQAAPHTIHKLVRDRDRVWGAFCKILRGTRQYSDVPVGFGKFRILWKPAVRLATLISWFKPIRTNSDKNHAYDIKREVH